MEEPVVNVSDKVLADPLFKLNSSNVQKTDEVEETIEEKEKEEKRLARPMENKTI